MKSEFNPQFTLPASFQAEEFFPRGSASAEEACYLIDTIISRKLGHHADSNGFVSLSSNILKRFIDNRRLAPIQKRLVEAGVIEIDPRYVPGEKSKGFRLTAPYLADVPCRRAITHPRVLAKIEKGWERTRVEQEGRTRPIHVFLKEAQRGLSFGIDPAPLLESLPRETWLCQRTLVNNIQSGNMQFNIGTTARVYNAITGVKRDLRQLLDLGGEPMENIDIRCSQYAMLGILIKAYYAGMPLDLEINSPPVLDALKGLGEPVLPADVERYIDCVNSGQFYEQVLSEARRLFPEKCGVWDRDKIKQRLMADILAPKKPYRCEVREAFENLFPTVARFTKQHNRFGHKRLIRDLQRLEADIVIHGIATKHADQRPIVTLHDAIYARQNDTQAVAQSSRDTFTELNINLEIKIEGSKRSTIRNELRTPQPDDAPAETSHQLAS